MTKKMKAPWYILCACLFIGGLAACKSQPEPQPEPKPEPVKPVEPAKNEDQEKADKLFQELSKVRAEAIELKADAAYPAQFKAADDTAAAAKSAYEAKDFKGAHEKAETAITQYRTLINQMHIAALKAKINEHDLSSYDVESYKKAEELYNRITELYESDPAGAFEASVQALNYYESVSNAGFAALMDDAKKKADEARARCDSIKAAAAMKDAYTNAINRYRHAGIAAGNKKYEQAYTGYMTAASEFNDIYETVKVKRAQANDAMKRAKARQEASTRLAKDADREAPLPEGTEGFSEEPIEPESLKQPSGSSATGGN